MMTPSKRFVLDLVDLTKPRICFLSLVMAAWGFLLGSPDEFSWMKFMALLAGLGLVGAASGVFNQVAEKEIDGKMFRTLHRPLPAGRVRDQQALFLGFICLILGEVILVVAVNPLTAVLAALTVLSYIGMYTPSKQTTPFSTLIGAIPGALPPLTGYTAAAGKFGPLGFWIFLLLFLWQVPHFLAIGWVYRDDYRRASLPILSVTDEEGGEVSKQVLIYLLALIPLTLLPAVWRVNTETYLWGAVILGMVFMASGIFLAWKRSLKGARVLFFVSILYLPVLGGLMVGTLN